MHACISLASLCTGLIKLLFDWFLIVHFLISYILWGKRGGSPINSSQVTKVIWKKKLKFNNFLLGGWITIRQQLKKNLKENFQQLDVPMLSFDPRWFWLLLWAQIFKSWMSTWIFIHSPFNSIYNHTSSLDGLLSYFICTYLLMNHGCLLLEIYNRTSVNGLWCCYVYHSFKFSMKLLICFLMVNLGTQQKLYD